MGIKQKIMKFFVGGPKLANWVYPKQTKIE